MASNKRARSSITQVADVKVDELQLRNIPGSTIIIDAARQILRLNLTPNGSIPTRFGFQTYGGESRPFMRGEASDRRSDGMNITLQVAGALADGAITDRRPFRAPHHSASMAALTGGGLHAKPGEVSLAHHGVLFLDELPEFSPQALDSLRQPLETGEVAIAQSR
jgi:predicted ATP-dependent protease